MSQSKQVEIRDDQPPERKGKRGVLSPYRQALRDLQPGEWFEIPAGTNMNSAQRQISLWRQRDGVHVITYATTTGSRVVMRPPLERAEHGSQKAGKEW